MVQLQGAHIKSNYNVLLEITPAKCLTVGVVIEEVRRLTCQCVCVCVCVCLLFARVCPKPFNLWGAELQNSWFAVMFVMLYMGFS